MLLILSLLFLSGTYAQVFFPDEVPNDPDSFNDRLTEALNITNKQNFNFFSPATSSSSCFTPAGERGTCGPLVRCGNLIPFVLQLGNPTVNRFFRERICRLLLRSIHICCPTGNPVLPFGNGAFPLQPQPVTPPRPVPQPQPVPQPFPVPQRPSVFPEDTDCGIPGGARVTGGTEVKPGFWPWLAAVGQRIEGNVFFVSCGGTLITLRHVVTAAHCFGEDRNNPNLVMLGEHHLDNDFAGERPEEFRIVSQRSNAYNDITNENDIALLTLDRIVNFNDFIRPACLPFQFRNQDFEGQSLIVVGWGRTTFENRVTSKVPMEANVPVVRRSSCATAYQRLRNKPVIDSRQLCAGTGGQDSCNGDSGGPLNYLDLQSGRYYLVGIVSFGVECARPDYPGVYTRVSSFLDWIEQNL